MSKEMYEADFLDALTPPSTGGGFTKIEAGDNTFRALSKPIPFWTVWNDKADGTGREATRSAFTSHDNKPTGKEVKFCWAIVVWNYNTKRAEIFDIDKKSVQDDLLTFMKNPKWGALSGFDFVVNKTGTGKTGTKYRTTAEPHSDRSEEINEAIKDVKINLKKYVIGENPYEGGEAAPAEAAPTPAPEPVAEEKPAPKKGKKTPPPSFD